MILTVALLMMMEPFGFQKEARAVDLIVEMSDRVARPGWSFERSGVSCDILESGVDIGHSLPGQVVPGRTSVLLCAFETKCGERGERHIFHTEFYAAWKPAESFSWTLAPVCPEMLLPAVLDQLPDHLRGAE